MLNRKGQNTAEYAILIALIVAVAVGTQTYIKRGVQSRMRDESKHFSDAAGDTTAWNNISSAAANVTIADQWEPGEFSRKSTQVVRKDEEKSTLDKTGSVTREVNKTTSQATGDYRNLVTYIATASY